MRKSVFSVFFLMMALGTYAQCVSGNCSTGNGTYRWANGDMYVGDWVDGKRTGYGRYDWADGSYYVGNFKDDLLQGKGAYYAADGTSMVGEFDKNNFLEGKPADTSQVITDANALDEFRKQEVADSIALATALKQATQLDFCDAVVKLVKDFPNNFNSYIGPQQVKLINLSSSWYSTLMIKNTPEAGINSGYLSGNHSFYNILFEAPDYETARKKYDEYVNLMKGCSVGCCTLVYDPYEYKGETYTSYSTSWLTFTLNQGAPEIYSDMVIEIELMSKIADQGWGIYFRIYHLSDLNNK